MASSSDVPAKGKSPASQLEAANPEPIARPWLVIDKTLSTAANLSQLLPTGTVLAFQALAPSFSRRGNCRYASNRYLTSALILVLAASCALFSLTDSLTGGDGRLYYGVATLRGLYVFNFDGADADKKNVLGELERYRLRPQDVVHAFFTVLVFLTLAFGDAMIHNCLFPGAGPNARELLVNLPLIVGLVSTLVFMIFPTSRKGIGYTNMATSSSERAS